MILSLTFYLLSRFQVLCQKNSLFRGSPARLVETRGREQVPFTKTGMYVKVNNGPFATLSHLFGLVLIVALIESSIGVAAYLYFQIPDEILPDYLSYTICLVFGPPVAGIIYSFQTILFKWLLIGRVLPGLDKITFGSLWKHWLLNHMYDVPLVSDLLLASLNGSIFVTWYLRALGASISYGAFVANLKFCSDFDLFTCCEGTWMGSNNLIFCSELFGKYIKRSRVTLDANVIMAEHCVLTPSTWIKEGCTIGSLSSTQLSANQEFTSGSTWFGCPIVCINKGNQSKYQKWVAKKASLALLRRLDNHWKTYDSISKKQDKDGIAAVELNVISSDDAEQSEFVDAEAFQIPKCRYYMARIATEFLNLFSLILLACALIPAFLLYSYASSYWGRFAVVVLPFAYALIGCALTILIVIFKYFFIPRFTGDHQLFSSHFIMWVWFGHLLTFIQRFVGLYLSGTPAMSVVLRALGSHVGHHVYWDCQIPTETDCIFAGDETVICQNVVLIGHVVDNSRLQHASIRLEARSSVNSESLIQPGTTLGSLSTIGCLSLIMKGDTLAANHRWHGLPVQQCNKLRYQRGQQSVACL